MMYRRGIIIDNFYKGGHVLEEEKAIIQYQDELASFFSPIFQEIDRRGKGKNHPESQLLDLPDLEKKITEIIPFLNHK